jgi:hypothetical protein
MQREPKKNGHHQTTELKPVLLRGLKGCACHLALDGNRNTV